MELRGPGQQMPLTYPRSSLHLPPLLAARLIPRVTSQHNLAANMLGLVMEESPRLVMDESGWCVSSSCKWMVLHGNHIQEWL